MVEIVQFSIKMIREREGRDKRMGLRHEGFCDASVRKVNQENVLRRCR